MAFTQQHGTWGERLRTFQWDGGLVTLLFLQPNKRCSWHVHKANWNQFTLITGKVGIKTDRGFETILKNPKDTFTVEPGVWHEFRVYEHSVVEEVAYRMFDENDIDRKELGGDLEVQSEKDVGLYEKFLRQTIR